MNSIGLNLLILIQERAKKLRGKVMLVQVSPLVTKLLKMTKLYPLFEITETVEEAFETFASHKD